MEQSHLPPMCSEELDTLKVVYVQMKEDFRLMVRTCFTIILIFLGVTGVAVRFLPDPAIPNDLKTIIAVVSITIGCFEAIVAFLILRWLHHNRELLETVCGKLGIPNDMSHATLSKSIYLALVGFFVVVIAWFIVFLAS